MYVLCVLQGSKFKFNSHRLRGFVLVFSRTQGTRKKPTSNSCHLIRTMRTPFTIPISPVRSCVHLLWYTRVSHTSPPVGSTTGATQQVIVNEVDFTATNEHRFDWAPGSTTFYVNSAVKAVRAYSVSPLAWSVLLTNRSCRRSMSTHQLLHRNYCSMCGALGRLAGRTVLQLLIHWPL